MSEPVAFYQVDAFADRPFAGNPAAVCLYETWLPDDLMQTIAAENNLSETAFVVPEGDDWGLRWFTPTTEVDLCGHATLAAAAVILEDVDPEASNVLFLTPSGPLGVGRDDGRYALDFPSIPPLPLDGDPGLFRAPDSESSASGYFLSCSARFPRHCFAADYLEVHCFYHRPQRVSMRKMPSHGPVVDPLRRRADRKWR